MTREPSLGRFERAWHRWMLVGVVALVTVAALAAGFAVHPSDSLGRDYVRLTSVEWVDSNGTVFATSGGVNLSQGQSFTLAELLHCPPAPSTCPGAVVRGVQGATGFGNWPAGVSPCGWFRTTFLVTGSNLPQGIPPNGTVAIDLSLQAPIVSYPNTQQADQPFNYTGYLAVELGFSP